MNVHSYTEKTLEQYPAYISVNLPSNTPFERIEITVRSRGMPYGAKIELTHAESKELAEKLLAFISIPTHAERLMSLK